MIRTWREVGKPRKSGFLYASADGKNKVMLLAVDQCIRNLYRGDILELTVAAHSRSASATYKCAANWSRRLPVRK